MNKITIGQFLEYTNVYVPIYIEDEFRANDGFEGKPVELMKTLKESQLECPIDYIRNVDGGHLGDEKKTSSGIVLGIGFENYNKYFN